MSDDTSTENSEEQTTTNTSETSSEETTSQQENSTQETKTETETKETKETSDAPVTADQIKVPEGFDFPEDRMNASLDIINEYKIPMEAVDKLLGLNAEWAKAGAEETKQEGPTWNETIDTWQEETKALPKLGGENFEKSAATVNRLLAEITGPSEDGKDPGFATEFDQMLDITGAGSNPLMFRFFYAVAEKLGVREGSPAPGGQVPSGTQDMAKRLFPNQN